MIVPDANLLIYAHDKTAPQHNKAKQWWEDALSGVEPVGLPWIVALAFVRLMTHPTLSDNPMSVDQARECVEGWLDQPNCRMLPAGPSTVQIFFDMQKSAGVGGNLTTDAMIAAVATEYSGTVYSNDHDFNRFQGLSWRNPL